MSQSRTEPSSKTFVLVRLQGLHFSEELLFFANSQVLPLTRSGASPFFHFTARQVPWKASLGRERQRGLV